MITGKELLVTVLFMIDLYQRSSVIIDDSKRQKTFVCYTLLFSSYSLQGTSAWTSCRNTRVTCAISIAGVSDASDVKHSAVCHTHKQANS